VSLFIFAENRCNYFLFLQKINQHRSADLDLFPFFASLFFSVTKKRIKQEATTKNRSFDTDLYNDFWFYWLTSEVLEQPLRLVRT
jgi:hypothetical protein